MNILLGFFIRIILNIDGSVNGKGINSEAKNRKIEDFMFYIYAFVLPTEIFGYLLWCIIFWRGTSYHILFSKGNVVVLTIFGVLDIGIHLFIVIEAVTSFNHFSNSLSFILVCNLVNQSLVYFKYLWTFKKLTDINRAMKNREETERSDSSYNRKISAGLKNMMMA